MSLNGKNKSELYNSTIAELNVNDNTFVNEKALEKYIKNMGTQNNNERPFPEDTKTENEQQNNKIDTKEDDTKEESKKQKEAFNKQFDASRRAINFLNKKNLKEKGNFSADDVAMNVLKEDSKKTKIRIFNGCCSGFCFNCCKGSKIKNKAQLVSGKICSPETNIGANNTINENKQTTVKDNQKKSKGKTKNRFYGCCSGWFFNCCKKANVDADLAIAKANVVSPKINLGKIDANMVNLGNN